MHDFLWIDYGQDDGDVNFWLWRRKEFFNTLLRCQPVEPGRALRGLRPVPAGQQRCRERHTPRGPGPEWTGFLPAPLRALNPAPYSFLPKWKPPRLTRSSLKPAWNFSSNVSPKRRQRFAFFSPPPLKKWVQEVFSGGGGGKNELFEILINPRSRFRYV